mgnify:CR=1 FL=1
MSADEILADLFEGIHNPPADHGAVYLGVENYGTVTKNEKESSSTVSFIDGDIKDLHHSR